MFKTCVGLALSTHLAQIGPRLDQSLLEVDKGQGDARRAGVAALCGEL
jgi:hypothetical protein